MKPHQSNGLLTGAIFALISNIFIGYIYGSVIGSYLDRTYSGPPTESFKVLAFIFPFVLITSGGPIAGAIVGYLISGSSSRRRGVLIAPIVGSIHGFLANLSTGIFEFSMWAHYSLLAIVSALICNLVVYRDTFNKKRNRNDTEQ